MLISLFLEESGKTQKVNYSKLFLIQSMSELFSTSHLENKKEYTRIISPTGDALSRSIISQFCELLIKTCLTGELLQISYALDGFYEVFSEEDYNDILKEHNIIDQMASGAQGLEDMLERAKLSKTYSSDELGKIEDALMNVKPFVEYKRSKGL